MKSYICMLCVGNKGLLITFRGVRRNLSAGISSFKRMHHLILFFVSLSLFHDLHSPLRRQQRVVKNVEGHALCFWVAYAVVFSVVSHKESVTG